MRNIGPRAQAGVGLIEVLVSLLVLSIGMLGLAGLQMYSLRNNQGAMERSMAVVETHSIVDAMRADRAAALAGEFDFDPDDAGKLGGESFAERSLQSWHANLINSLGPSASGAVTCTSTGVCTITVRWTDERAVANTAERKAAAPQQEVITEVRL
jgi:type IV pilus assembly protein PilV